MCVSVLWSSRWLGCRGCVKGPCRCPSLLTFLRFSFFDFFDFLCFELFFSFLCFFALRGVDADEVEDA